MKILVSFVLLVLLCVGTGFVFPEDDGVHYAQIRDDECGVLNEDSGDARTVAPWTAALFEKDGSEWKYLFSGTVIGPNAILTLGRRLWENIDGTWKLKVPAGNTLLVGVGLKSTKLSEKDEYSQISEVTFIRPHTKFNEKTRIHDVALIHLKTALNLSTPYVRAACLPKFPNQDPDADFFVPGTLATHGGFDWHSRKDGYRELKVVSIRMQTYDHCLQAFRRLESKTPFYLYCARVASRGLVQSNNLCLFYGSSPVIPVDGKHYIVGLNSVFTLTGPNYSCDRNSVNWFSRLNGTLDWIQQGLACGPNKWSCGGDQCVDFDKVCDQKRDCSGDGPDEDPIFCRGLNPCSVGDFECGAYGACISKSEVCNGRQSCENGEDEDPFGACAGKFAIPKGCSPIQQTEGVKIECKDPESNRRVDCSNRNRQPVALGVQANLTCERYYISSVNRPSVRRQCTGNGQWSPAISFGCYPDCGKADKALNLLIVKGSLTSRDSWPWHSAIFKFNEDEEAFSYICGGSVVHRSAIITAAHCLLTEYKDFDEPSKFKVILAPVSSNYAENQKDPQAQIFDIKSFSTPSAFNTRNFEADIAVVELGKPVVFNDYIRPVCYPSTTQLDKAIQKYQLSHNVLGQVIGFGIDESEGVSNLLKFANLPVRSTKECLEVFGTEPRDSSYCAGYTNGTGACNGDSGGGMVFSEGTGVHIRYYIQGVVSHSPRREDSLLCNAHTYTMFTKVGFYSEWIDEQLQKIEIS